MMTRSISTACCRLTARASSRGAVPNTSPATAGRSRSGWRIQSTNAAIPACATRPSHDRFSADMARNQGSRLSIDAMAAVPRLPIDRSMRATVSSCTRLTAEPPGTRLPFLRTRRGAPACSLVAMRLEFHVYGD